MEAEFDPASLVALFNSIEGSGHILPGTFTTVVRKPSPALRYCSGVVLRGVRRSRLVVTMRRVRLATPVLALPCAQLRTTPLHATHA